ncbi:MAG: hypothetical protein CSA11_05665 [Chloroflexi bacterium]|nr:MAG: hypothetical protein CSB13_08545 [Chloroflexota bacterium]PIE80946.1 MAG: hypothetical protein CSA11_05665 [Chloroflexota bacterium]
MSNNTNEFGAFLAGFVIGGLVGAATALILAPQSGEQTRGQIATKSSELRETSGQRIQQYRQLSSDKMQQYRQLSSDKMHQYQDRASHLWNHDAATNDEDQTHIVLDGGVEIAAAEEEANSDSEDTTNAA